MARRRLGRLLLLTSALLCRPAWATPTPPPAAGFVDLAQLDPTIRFDLRYATTRNFTGVAIYPAARCLLRADVAQRLVRVQQRVAATGLGLLLWDCYRPFSVQERFWAVVPDARYVAEPRRVDGHPAQGSKHNRGAAVDLTLVDRNGQPLVMPTDFDDFSERAHRGNALATPTARANAQRLEAAMRAEGFEPMATEWWHFDGPGWERYPLADIGLE